MLWCAACCEPFHTFCLSQEDIPPSTNGNFTEKQLQDWICRRCSLCQICGLSGDIQTTYSEKEVTDKDTRYLNKGVDKRTDEIPKPTDILNPQRQRLRCQQCGGVFHSDCLQPSQQKMIKGQGSQWVRFSGYMLVDK